MVRHEITLQVAAACVVTLLLALAGCEKDKVVAPVDQPPGSSEEVIQALAGAYRSQDYVKFELLLADDFLYIFDEPNPVTGEVHWNAATERRVHTRMFDPERIPPTDLPVPMENWLQAVNITLTLEAAFVERTDLYTTAMPPGPLDPARWIARSANYGTDVFFQMQGETDYQVSGRANFTVIEDRNKMPGEPCKFLLYRWEDLGANARLATEGARWTGVKSIYR
jgi:hypothetical protein